MNAMTRLFALTTLAGACASAWGNPTGAVVARGAALLSNPSANVLQVVNTPGTVINWQGFSIGAAETTRFVQQNAASAVLNRVTGGNPSSILGRLDSNGRVFLINPNGIVFGGGSVVDVAGLIASTRNISDANFAAGNYLFEGGGNGAITMQAGARILTSTYGPGGQVWLFANNVTQEAGSTITAPQGQVVLAAGTQVQVGQSQLGNMTFNVSMAGGETVDLLGTIAAERGAVGLFADNIKVRDGGIVSTSAGTSGNGGSISMNARTLLEIERLADVAADGGTADGNGGTITLTAADIRVSPVANAYGNLHASARAFGAQHGTVTIDQMEATSLSQVADVTVGGFRTGETSSPFFGIQNQSVAVLADGSYLLVWSAEVHGMFNGSNRSGTDIMAMNVGANGSAVGGPFIVAAHSWTQNSYRPELTDTTDQRNPLVAALKGGGYVVAWESDSNVFVGDGVTSSSGSHTQPRAFNMKVFGTNGTTGPVSLASDTRGGLYLPPGLAIAALADGDFVASWRALPGPSFNNWKIQIQRFDAGGSSVGSAANTGIDVGYGVPKIAGLGGDGYVYFPGFYSFFGPTNTATNLHRFDNSGNLVASSVVPEPGLGVSGLVGGGYALGQNALSAPSGFVQRFAANGTRLGSAIPFDAAQAGAVNTSVVGTADGAAVAIGGSIDAIAAGKDGGHAVAYLKFVTANNYDGTDLQLRIMTKRAATSLSSSVAGEAGASASFETRPGAMPGAVVLPPPPAPQVPVVSSNPGERPGFGGVSGCTSAECATEVQGAISAADAMRAASNMKISVGAIDAAAASRAVDALIEADANRAAVDRLIAGDADRAAAAAAKAAAEADQMAVDAMIEADANRAQIDRMIAADADRAAIDQLIEQSAQRSEAATAATAAAARAKAAAAAAEAKANSVKDARTQGGFILIGDAEIGRVLDDRTMTPQQKVAALDRLQQQELADQQFGTAPDGDRNVEGSRGALARDNLFKSLWASMSPEERRITVENYDKALRAGGEADLLDSVPDSASRR